MNKLSSILKTDTFRKSSITFSSSLINGALGALFFVLTARFLGPINFGTLSIAIAALTLTKDIADLGTDTGLVRFVSKYAVSKPKKAMQFLRLGLLIKLAVGVGILAVGLVFAGPISSSIFAKPELAAPLRIAALGVLGALLFDFAVHSFQAYQKFWHWSGLFIGTNSIRLAMIAILVAMSQISLNNSLAVYILMPFIGFIFSLFFLPNGFWKFKSDKDTRKEFFHYNKWIAAMTAVSAVSSRMDTFISARLLSLDQVGIYSAANQLVRIVPQLAGALGTVMAPKMSSQGNIKELVKYLKKSQIFVFVIVILGLLAAPIASFLIPVLYGPNYVASVPIFVVLLLAMLIFLFSIPIHNSIFYYFSKPKLFFWLALGHMSIIVCLGQILISTYGAIGAAFTVLAGSIFNFLVPAAWVMYNLRNEKL